MRALRWVMMVLLGGMLAAACHQESGSLPPTVRWSAIPDRGLDSVRAHASHGAIALVMRDIDTRFTSVVVVRAGDPARSLRDLRGRSFTFGNRDSTSGHFMARYFLGIEAIEPERFFSRVEYSAPASRLVLERESAGGFLPAEPDDFRLVADVLRRADRL